jgi:uncharacterized protein (DUF1697 family)
MRRLPAVPTYVSLLRGINVSGRQIAMADLRALYEALGHEAITTYVQSGNVVSTSRVRSPAAVGRAAEQAIRHKLGLDVAVVVRTVPELTAVVAGNPFVGTPADPATLHVTFLAEAVPRAKVDRIDGARFLPDEFAMTGRREVYVHCPNGYGRTKINNTFFEKQLGVAATTRNWKTVRTLLDLATT